MPNSYRPELLYGVPNQTAPEGVPFTFTIPSDAFFDQDGNELVYFASIDDNRTNNLPPWLSYNARTRTLVGTPPANTDDLRIYVGAFDGVNWNYSSLFLLPRYSSGQQHVNSIQFINTCYPPHIHSNIEYSHYHPIHLRHW